MSKRIWSFALLLSFFQLQATAQQPIGAWQAYLPYNNCISLSTDGVTLYAASDGGFYSYNAATHETTTYSKVNGMSDVDIQKLQYDPVTGYVVIVYRNGNIDLFQNETFFNIPDIKLKNISPKQINDVYCEGGFVYVSTSFGIVVINPDKKETRETYSFMQNNQTIEVKDFAALGNSFYAITSAGILKANKNNPNLQAFSSWQIVSTNKTLSDVAVADNQLFAAGRDSVFLLDQDSLRFVYRSPDLIVSLDSRKGGLFIGQFINPEIGKVVLFDAANLQPSDYFRTPKSVKTVELSDGSVWCADAYEGLGKRVFDSAQYQNPDGPSGVGSFDILPYNGDVWVAHGGYDENWTYLGNAAGISHFKNDRWTQYNQKKIPFFRDHRLADFIVLAKNPVNGNLYAGSYRDGLLTIVSDGSFQLEKYGSDLVEHHYIDTGSYRVAGILFDENNNLWINNAGALHELAVRTPEGKSHKFTGPGALKYDAYVVEDDYGTKWYIQPGGADGIIAYNDNHSPTNPSDDISLRLTASKADLSGYINCIVHDKENAIWIGTNDGIGVINCSPSQIASGQCEVRKPIVQFDIAADYLFKYQKVKTIAVDGANRKWVGTTNGVWLISPEGDKIVYRFTAENSPLPSDNIQKIAVDPITGVVYIGTSSGLVSFRSTATEGAANNDHLLVFPNPVPSGYTGTVAIKGLVGNADVRITDVGGQLVYRTTALGGQAVWNGKDYTGRRPQSGVYLIFVTDREGAQTRVGKMVFME